MRKPPVKERFRMRSESLFSSESLPWLELKSEHLSRTPLTFGLLGNQLAATLIIAGKPYILYPSDLSVFHQESRSQLQIHHQCIYNIAPVALSMQGRRNWCKRRQLQIRHQCIYCPFINIKILSPFCEHLCHTRSNRRKNSFFLSKS
jgi:hypothetical protein